MSSLAAIAATVRVISDIFIDANEPFRFVMSIHRDLEHFQICTSTLSAKKGLL